MRKYYYGLKAFLTSWKFSNVWEIHWGYFLYWSLLTFQSCDFVPWVESQRLSRLENYEEVRWPCTVFRDPITPRCQRFSDACSPAAFQKQEGGERNEFFPSTKTFRQLKTLVLSFLTCPNFNTSHHLNTCVELLLCIKPPCLHVTDLLSLSRSSSFRQLDDSHRFEEAGERSRGCGGFFDGYKKAIPFKADTRDLIGTY